MVDLLDESSLPFAFWSNNRLLLQGDISHLTIFDPRTNQTRFNAKLVCYSGVLFYVRAESVSDQGR